MLTWVEHRLYEWDGVDPMRNPKEPATAILMGIGNGEYMVAFHKDNGWIVIENTVFPTAAEAKAYAETIVRMHATP